MQPSNKIPEYIREQIAKEFHMTNKTNDEIGREYGIHKGSVNKVASEYTMQHFMELKGRPFRVLSMITRKLQEVTNNNDLDTLNKVAEVLSRV